MLKEKRDKMILNHDRDIKELKAQLRGANIRINEIIKIMKRQDYDKERGKNS